MCGIVGYVGKKNCIPILLDGLKSLEYRGYDSAGIAGRCDNELNVFKAKGEIKNARNQKNIQKISRTGQKCLDFSVTVYEGIPRKALCGSRDY